MLPEWEDAEERPAWTQDAQAWYGRQLNSKLRDFLFDQPAFADALFDGGFAREDPYRDALQRIEAWYLERPPLVEWKDDELYRPETLSGGYKILWGAVRDALLRAVRDVLADLEAEHAAEQRYIEIRVARWLAAEDAGRPEPGPAEPSAALLLSRQTETGGFAERGRP